MKLEGLEIFMKTDFGEILVLYGQPRSQGLYPGLGAGRERGCPMVGSWKNQLVDSQCSKWDESNPE